MGAFEGKIAFITGAARGQGRAHAVRLAREGAQIIAVDLCEQIDSVAYPLASPADLERTVELVRAEGAQIFAAQADVRDRTGLQAAFDAGVVAIGVPDIVIGNAGIAAMSPDAEDEWSLWKDVIDVNLTGIFNTVEVARPSMIEAGSGGSIVLTSSTAGLAGIGVATPGSLAYAASKHGIVGLMRTYANLLAPHSIRVNSVHPTGVNTPMIMNDFMKQLIEADPTVTEAFTNALPVPVVEAEDVTNAIVWLCSEAGRYITGVTLPVDAGLLNKV